MNKLRIAEIELANRQPQSLFLYTLISPSSGVVASIAANVLDLCTNSASPRAGLPSTSWLLNTLGQFTRKFYPALLPLSPPPSTSSPFEVGKSSASVCSAGHRLFQHYGQGALVSSPSMDSQVCPRKRMWLGCTKHNTKR